MGGGVLVLEAMIYGSTLSGGILYFPNLVLPITVGGFGIGMIQAVITSRTLYLGGTTGPVKNMNPAQLHALDHGYTYGLLWVAAVALLVGAPNGHLVHAFCRKPCHKWPFAARTYASVG